MNDIAYYQVFCGLGLGLAYCTALYWAVTKFRWLSPVRFVFVNLFFVIDVTEIGLLFDRVSYFCWSLGACVLFYVVGRTCKRILRTVKLKNEKS
jgi:hypothetical protein